MDFKVVAAIGYMLPVIYLCSGTFPLHTPALGKVGFDLTKVMIVLGEDMTGFPFQQHPYQLWIKVVRRCYILHHCLDDIFL